VGIHLKQQLKDKLIEHTHHIAQYGEDLPGIRHWTWGSTHSSARSGSQ
jgi:xylulose-5-phosphate/fructose-6-phosphate phosphoketolase